MTFSKQSLLSFGAWNIDSLHSRLAGTRHSKFDFPQVRDLLKDLDIFCLSETHCGTTDNIELEDFHIVQTVRPKSKRSTRHFGGIAVGVKLSILKGITFLKSTNSEFMWIIY
jgi:exonuclease III